jgi:hypothetical protein
VHKSGVNTLTTSIISGFAGDPPAITNKASDKSLALIGNASGTVFGRSRISIRGVFDEETRRKPLVFAVDAGSYGI